MIYELSRKDIVSKEMIVVTPPFSLKPDETLEAHITDVEVSPLLSIMVDNRIVETSEQLLMTSVRSDTGKILVTFVNSTTDTLEGTLAIKYTIFKNREDEEEDDG